MTIEEALDILECINNLEEPLGYLAKHHLRIKEAAGVAADTIKKYQAYMKNLRYWEVMDER